MSRLLLCAGALVLCACASQPAEPTTPRADDAPKPVAPPRPWAELSTAEKKQHMNDHVLPVMAAELQRFDAERYAGFSCDTCHGADMVERNFAMPNPKLLALHPTGSPEQQEMVQDHPQMVKLMFNRVLPAMQTMLGAQPYDAETKTGFSCYACHPHAQESLAAP